VSIIATDRLTKWYGTSRGILDVTFEVEPGEVFGFLGPNGAGKTTTLRTLLDFIRPTSGGARIFDLDAHLQAPAIHGRIGFVSGDVALYEKMTGRELFTYLGNLRGGVDPGGADRIAERIDLDPTIRIDRLSHGNRQKVALVQALMHGPELLVLDEPFAGLDPVAVRTLADVLRDEATRGAAVLFSSHQLELVEDICEEVAIVDHGRIVATGDVDTLRRASRRRRIELQLEGAPPEWLPGLPGLEVVDRRDGALRLLAGREVDPEQVLSDAEQHGRVVSFAYGPPSLADVFLELVTP
jgi:ABC-2 type transport system ATP-binding protein